MDPADFVLAQAQGHLIRRAQQIHTEYWAALVGPEPTSPQFAVLLSLFHHPASDQSTLAALASLHPSTCQDVVARLHAKHLLSRAVDPADRRRWLLDLTEEGREQVRAVLADVEEVGDRLVESLNDEDRAQLITLLSTMTSASTDSWVRKPAVETEGLEPARE